jgi:hypothetical protein
MQRDMMILVCHSADGHFADGDRQAVRRVLNQSEYIASVNTLSQERYAITCADGGRLELHAPGLRAYRSFHRIELFVEAGAWTDDTLKLVYDLMRAGGFGLMNNLDMPQFIVTQPQQVSYFPWLPEPPVLIRNSQDLGQNLTHSVL